MTLFSTQYLSVSSPGTVLGTRDTVRPLWGYCFLGHRFCGRQYKTNRLYPTAIKVIGKGNMWRLGTGTRSPLMRQVTGEIRSKRGGRHSVKGCPGSGAGSAKVLGLMGERVSRETNVIKNTAWEGEWTADGVREGKRSDLGPHKPQREWWLLLSARWSLGRLLTEQWPELTHIPAGSF